MKRVSVVLMNLGGPSDLLSVRPFLFNLFYDKSILNLPNPFRWASAHIISRLREKKAKEIYKKMGGKSPILDETKKQASKLQEFLNHHKEALFRVSISMRYSNPFSSQTIKDVMEFNPTDIVLLPLYPQFSTTTTDSSLKDFKSILKQYSWAGTLHTIPCFFQREGFLSVMEREICLQYKAAQSYGTPTILWTAHGLPEKIILKGDPYQKQVENTVSLLEKRLEGRGDFRSIICYQSRVGPLKWIGPHTIDEVEKAGKNKTPLIVVPISFVSEHAETLVELDIEYKNIAIEKGVPFYGRASTVRAHPDFIHDLCNLILSTVNHSQLCLFKDDALCCLNWG